MGTALHIPPSHAPAPQLSDSPRGLASSRSRSHSRRTQRGTPPHHQTMRDMLTPAKEQVGFKPLRASAAPCCLDSHNLHRPVPLAHCTTPKSTKLTELRQNAPSQDVNCSASRGTRLNLFVSSNSVRNAYPSGPSGALELEHAGMRAAAHASTTSTHQLTHPDMT